ncbi:unnamed protein product [Effrenium voratum]|nr:unnamed protein product [Effrenium voratum]
MRSMHASCGTAMADTSKIFMAKFVRAGSLLSAHGSLRTPELLAEMRAWMDERQRSSGLDSAAIWLDGDDHGVLDPSSCGQLSPWFVRPSVALGAAPDLLCQVPEVFQERKPGEVFEIHILIGNTGERPWPAGTVLSLRDGDPMGGPAGLRLQEVPPGSTVPLALSLQAPLEGKAYSVWSLADGDRVPFGTLIWVDAAVEGPEARVQPGWEVEQAEPARSTAEGCEVFWSQPIFQELSSQTSALPTASSPDRGRPRLCWSLGHRFWFAELSFHHVKPPETFVFGFCVPAQCEGKEVDLQIAKPFLRRLSSSSSGSDWCRLELHEWTQELQGFLPLLPLVVLALWRGQKGDPQDLQLWPCLLRLLATACLAVYHFASFPVYAAPGLPAGLLHFVTFGFGILHDPLFTALSASLLLRGGPPSWNWRTMAGRLGRKWLRLAPVGVASRVLLCFALRRIPSVPFLLNVQPRLNARLCSWSEAQRCTHHACTPQWGLVDALLAFPPLDFAGFFVEQDVVRSMLLALLALCLAGRWQLRMLGMGFLAATCWSLLRSMRDCVDDLGHVGGPCVPSPLTAYLDLPLATLFGASELDAIRPSDCGCPGTETGRAVPFWGPRNGLRLEPGPRHAGRSSMSAQERRCRSGPSTGKRAKLQLEAPEQRQRRSCALMLLLLAWRGPGSLESNKSAPVANLRVSGLVLGLPTFLLAVLSMGKPGRRIKKKSGADQNLRAWHACDAQRHCAFCFASCQAAPAMIVLPDAEGSLQDFYGKWLSTPGWREERLVKLARRSGMPDQRIRASLESNQVPVAFSFVDVCGGSITEDEIQLEHNTDWLEQWLESFSLDLPTQKECQAALTKVAKESDSGNKKETPKTPAQEPEACPAKKPKLTPNQEAAILCIFFAAAMSRLLEGPTWKAFKKKSRIRTLRCPALSNWQLPCLSPCDLRRT